MYDSLGRNLDALPIWFLLGLATILGAIWGSFVGALCSRWPKGESIAQGRSSCEQCGQNIASYDLIPVVSYLLLRGKCRNCGHFIGKQILGTELASALIGVLAFVLLSGTQALAAAVFGWLLLPLILLDFRHLWLPNKLVVALALAGLLAAPLLTPDISYSDRFIGVMAAYSSLELVRFAYQKLRQVDGMGAGDPKLFGALGIWLGWQPLPFALLLASLLGLAYVLINRAMKLPIDSALPLGSYLALAGLLLALTH